MNKCPLISVIIPAYNAEKYIERCIRSILNQTYSALEICVINDGSTDNTGVLLDKLAAEDERVKPIHQKNAGAAMARLTGIQHAAGDYLTFVDSDDYIDSRMIAHLLMLIQSDDYQISCCKSENVSETKGPSNTKENGDVREYDFDGIIKNLYVEGFWSVWGKLYSRSLFDGSNILAENLKVSEDLLMAYSLYKQCRRVIVSDRQYYRYYRHSGSVMAEKLNETQILDSMRAYQRIAEDMDASSKAYEYHIQNLLSNDFGFLNRIVLQNTCRSCYKTLRSEILHYRKYAFINKNNPTLNNRHRLGVLLLRFCPPLFDLLVRLKG